MAGQPLEVSPALAHDAEGTVDAARRLWTAIDRPNAMIKIPATAAGVTALATLIREGINVNVTLLFRAQVEATWAAHEATGGASGRWPGVGPGAPLASSSCRASTACWIRNCLRPCAAKRRWRWRAMSTPFGRRGLDSPLWARLRWGAQPQ